MDYFKIGQKIRKYRKAEGLSQEELAERIGISVTHMSHIETGNTKLSLPFFVEIANVLDVQTDDLLKDSPHGKSIATDELLNILNSCDDKQIKVIVDIIKATKISIDKHLN